VAHLQAARPPGRRIEVADETGEDMVPDMIEVSMDVRGRLRAAVRCGAPSPERPGEVNLSDGAV
jgi:hypothetical protein